MTADLAGRTIVVTGASRGIGRAVAVAVAAAGARVIAVARDQTKLTDLIAELGGSEHRAHAFDVRDQPAWSALAESLDRIDGLVTAAGIYGPIGRIDTVDLDEFRAAFEVNVIAPVSAIQACLGSLSERGGSIVLFAGGGADPLPAYDAYVSSKAAVVRLAENLAAELAPRAIRVNSIAPGFVATDIHRATIDAGPDRSGAQFHAQTVRALADGGFPATEAAGLVTFLLSDQSADISGRFLSARWDQWRSDEWWRDRLVGSDRLTMRRIDDELYRPGSSG